MAQGTERAFSMNQFHLLDNVPDVFVQVRYALGILGRDGGEHLSNVVLCIAGESRADEDASLVRVMHNKYVPLNGVSEGI